MNEYAAWLTRRARRTGWLLRDPATRSSMLRFLVVNTAGAALIYGRGAVRVWLRSGMTAPMEGR
jgi:hypothetical protein